MLIYNEKRQIERAEAICSLLEQEDLCDWAKEFWNGCLFRLAKGQEQLEYSYNNTRVLPK
tara:strand:+ start:2238 stop:2417 length:180 start_codon:yes stop_codon:yes gene_type:complete